MRRDSVTSKVVIDRQLVEVHFSQYGHLLQLLEEGVEVLRKLSLLLIFVDLVSPVFEDVAVVLHSSVVQFLPFTLVDVLE